MSNLKQLEEKLGYAFQNRRLLETAITHPSLTHEQSGTVEDNQRLEFLGDAVLQLILTCFLFENFPNFEEGPLTKARAQLVNRRTLAEQARKIGLGLHLRISRGEEMSGGRTRPSALADCFEAVLGAIFMDGGLDVARDFILAQFKEIFGELKSLPNLVNPKGELQELLQARAPDPIQYCLASVQGPDHDRVFECTVQYRGAELGRGSGRSKKEAEAQAALAALQRVKEENASS